MSDRFTISEDHLCVLWSVSRPALDGVRPDRAARIITELRRRSRLRQVYDATPPHADLCDFDAQGMDIIEGRRA